MIIKSLSRKAPTFRQLKSYLDRGGAPGVGFAWNLDRPWFAPDEDILRAFADTAAALRERSNGIKLFHEIVSVKRDDRLPVEVQQEILHDAVMEWLRVRAPDQLGYGRLHVEGGHLHVHLMLSANRPGDDRPVRLSRAAFADLQRQVEARVLERHPQFRQERVYDDPGRSGRGGRSFRHPRPDPDGRPGPTPDPVAPAAPDTGTAAADRDQVASVLRKALARAPDGRSCLEALRACGVDTRRRGSTVTFVYRERRYRLLSLGLPYEDAARFHAFLGLPPPAPGSVAREERRRSREAGQGSPGRPEPATERPEPEPASEPQPEPEPEPAAGESPLPPEAERAKAGAPGARPAAHPRWDVIARQPAALLRDVRRLFDLGVFGDTRAAYWGELVRAYRDAGGKPAVPSRSDLPGTRRQSPVLRRLLGAVQDEPAAIGRDVRRLLHDLFLGPGRAAPPTLEEVAGTVGFRSASPWRRLPPGVRLEPVAPPVPGQPPGAVPAAASTVPPAASPPPATEPAPPENAPSPPGPPAVDPRWAQEWRRRQAMRTALLRGYVRNQERQRAREQDRKRQKGRKRDDPGRGGR